MQVVQNAVIRILTKKFFRLLRKYCLKSALTQARVYAKIFIADKPKQSVCSA